MNEEEIKKRLVGSIVVVAAFVFFVPIFLDGDEGIPREISISEVPSRRHFELEDVPHNDDVVGRANLERPLPSNEIVEGKSASHESVDVFENSLNQLEIKINEQSTPVKSIQEGTDVVFQWIAQVGSFSNQKNAENLSSRLKKDSYTSYTQERGEESGKVYKVRVGPYLSKTDANKDLLTIEERYGVKGFLVKVSP